MSTEHFEIWSKCEDVAMHFNGLILQFRIQALGGLSALGTLTGFIIEKIDDKRQRYTLLGWISAGLIVAWTAVAALDLFYYRLLLKGAVTELHRLEAEHAVPLLRLSATIDDTVGWGVNMPWVFYGVVLAMALAVFFWALWKWRDATRALARSQPPPASTPPAAEIPPVI